MKTWHWLAIAAVGGYFLLDTVSPKIVTLKPLTAYRLSGPDINNPAIRREMRYSPAIGLGQTETIIIGQTIKADVINGSTFVVDKVDTDGNIFG